MATMIDFRELPDRFLELIAQAVAGAEVIVTDGETPRAILVPLRPPGSRVAELHPGAIQITPDFDAPLPDDFWMGRP